MSKNRKIIDNEILMVQPAKTKLDVEGLSIKCSVEKQKRSMSAAVEKQSAINPDKGVVMKDILDYMNSNYWMLELSQTHIAEKFCMSVSSLNRCFKSFTGRTYVDVLGIIRMDRMLELLEAGSMRDRDIGEAIGIPDPHYLSIWFKKMTGVSVTEYRNTRRADTAC